LTPHFQKNISGINKDLSLFQEILKFALTTGLIKSTTMRKLGFVSFGITAVIMAAFHALNAPIYSVSNIPLPPEMDKQVCISGMVYNGGSLYFASERCPLIIETEPLTGKITNRFHMEVPQNFEMEGVTAYNNKLFLVSENIAAVYEYNPATSSFRQVTTSIELPAKSRNGDGMEGIAANHTQKKFYLLRERNEEMTRSQFFTYAIDTDTSGVVSLRYESMLELPLENPQWRYSDICYDAQNARLICLKSYSKGRMRKQYIESIDIDSNGNLVAESVKNVPVENFSTISNQFKEQDYSMNLEGVTMDPTGNIFIVSDNTSGKAICDEPAKEKTILLMLKKSASKE
jgi:uncharacterized protein YjiK